MKLLIVDDEELTRNGLAHSLDWEALGITEVWQADDGINGLKTALDVRPDIVLCDVRMPRMDGITMLERIEAHLPDVTAIFMSGYSDKEYLKAAIKLKAVQYIEKPIDLEEMKSAIRQAAAQCGQIARQHSAEALHTNMAAAQLAFQLTVPYASCRATVEELCLQYRDYYGSDRFKIITTIIVKMERSEDNPADLPYVCQMLRDFLAPSHLHVIYSDKRLNHIVYHIYGTVPPAAGTLLAAARRLNTLFAPFGNYYIAIGDTVSGIANAYHSYESAVIFLQSSFFFAPGTVLTAEILAGCPRALPDDLAAVSEAYIQALSDRDAAAAGQALERLSSLCSRAFGLLPNQVRTVCYDLFSALYQTRRALKLMPDLTLENHENIMDIMDSCFSFSMLHGMLLAKTDALFADIRHMKPENATIFLIRDYISSHYREPGLSVKDISEYAHLSTSYACTFFKNETGVTLNQYITEFRMERAKQLLSDPRYRISDISTSIGYSDGNYFGKSFRKYTGLSPSEYREKVQK